MTVLGLTQQLESTTLDEASCPAANWWSQIGDCSNRARSVQTGDKLPYRGLQVVSCVSPKFNKPLIPRDGGRQMRAKRTSRAFMTSLVLHLAIAFIVSLYLVSQTRQFTDLVGVDVLKLSKPPKPTVRKPVVKSPIKPTVPTTNTVVVEQVEIQPRVTTTFAARSNFEATSVP